MTKNYIDDIQSIRSIMEERSRFLSLNGLAGVLVGIYALIGAYVGHKMSINASSVPIADIRQGEFTSIIYRLIIVALIVLFLSIGTSFILTQKKAKKRGESLWTVATKKLISSFLIPLVTGGMFGLILLWKGYVLLIAPTTLIFYGLALYSASRYTVNDIRALGITEIILGLVCMFYSGWGIYFWAFGFGILHILYGFVMYLKYDRNSIGSN